MGVARGVGVLPREEGGVTEAMNYGLPIVSVAYFIAHCGIEGQADTTWGYLNAIECGATVWYADIHEEYWVQVRVFYGES